MTEPMIDHLDAVWRDIAGLAADLTTEQWALPTECPGWSVHDNVSHMIGTERMLLGEQPATEPTDAPHVRNDIGKANEAWIATYRDWEGPALLDEFAAVTTRRLDALRAMSADDWDREGFTPEGPGPYRQFMEIRVFDCWYHDQDMREAIGRPGFLEGPVADLSIGRIPPKALGYIVGKKAAAAPGTTVVFTIEGATPIVAGVTVPPEGRALVTPGPLDTPTVAITADRRTFTRLAGGRWSGDHARSHGRLQVEGDTDLGARIVDSMGYTI
jgi:uncharacterized protein (TIGR03083 family)